MTAAPTFTLSKPKPESAADVNGAPSTHGPSLAARLRNVRVGLRQDLQVTRHLFRGAPCYVVHDAITFQCQRFDPPEYEILVRIRSDRSLGDIFDELAATGKVAADDQESFAEFVFSLHRLGFLRLPVSDDQSLYRRFKAREHADRKRQLLGFMFLRIPLWNPDDFLGRTVGYVRPFFTRAAFVAWLVWVGAAAFIGWRSWVELSNPLQDVLVTMNVPLLIATLVVLKVLHEFGHAYACKHYGGHVPELGAYLILFTPCAYVDASACWGFTRKRERLIVCLAGMYVETAIAAGAMFAWHLTDDVLIRSVAHHVILLASAVTVMFNINPLMRYDGYYVLSDLIEVPNLRQRAREYVGSLAKLMLLGVRDSRVFVGKRLRVILAGYGIASMLYRISMIVAITAILASKFFLVGLLVGALMLGGAVVGQVLGLTHYLWYSPETAKCRVRAVALSVLVLLILPAAAMWLPMPAGAHALGVLGAEQETLVRVRTAGVLEKLWIEAGDTVGVGDRLASLSNDSNEESVVVAEADLRSQWLQIDALRENDPARSGQALSQLPPLQAALEDANARAADLQLAAPAEGKVVQSVKNDDIGKFLTEGSPVATVVSGAWQVRAILTAEQMSSARPSIGANVEFRPACDPGTSLSGFISRITPAGSRQVGLLPLTHLGGGEVAVDPSNGTATEPYFEVTISLAQGVDDSLRYGMTGVVRLNANAEPVGTILSRRLLRFWNKLLQG